MLLRFEVAEQERRVRVSREADGLIVDVDGRTYRVDAVGAGADCWSLILKSEATGQPTSAEAAVRARVTDGGLDVQVEGHSIPVRLRAGFGNRHRAEGAAGAGPQRVTAPMPGKVVRVFVTPGDVVQARQGLVVVEAMKMENELRAARAGTVREVRVAEGESVEPGAVLVVLE